MHIHGIVLRCGLACGLALVMLVSCKSLDTYQVRMPETRGTQVAVLAIEVPANALAEGESATFDIAFEIGLRGDVVRSSMRATTRTDLQDSILEQHRQWIYAVATRQRPCAASTYAGVQRIAFTRTAGKLAMALEPARVERELESVPAEWVAARSMADLKPDSIRLPAYPRAALLDGSEGIVGVLFEFDADGRAKNAFPVNVANDRWGFTQAALATVARYQLKEPPGRTVRACQTFQFTLSR